MKGVFFTILLLLSLASTGCISSGCRRNYVISGEDGPTVVKPAPRLE